MDEKDLQELRELVEFLRENGIAEFDLHRGEQQVRIKFAQPAVAGFDPAQMQQFAAAAAAAQVPVPVAAPVAAAAAEPPVAEEKLHEVKSPIVGTF